MEVKRQPAAGLLGLHAAVLLFGLAGLFGKWLTLPPAMIVLGRTAFASAALFSCLAWRGEPLRGRSGRAFGWLVLSGVVLAVHWASFFAAIQASTVAVGLLTFSSFPLFVTLIEPWVFHERPRAWDFFTGLLLLAGLVLLVPRFDWGNRFAVGAGWGVLSGFTFAVLTLLNRRLVRTESSVFVAAWQDFFAGVALLFLLLAFPAAARARWPDARELALLAVLGILCTAVAHTLFIQGLSHVRAQVAGLVSGLEGVYGIALAFLFLGETPSGRVLFGGIVILLAVVLGTVKRSGRTAESLKCEG